MVFALVSIIITTIFMFIGVIPLSFFLFAIIGDLCVLIIMSIIFLESD